MMASFFDAPQTEASRSIVELCERRARRGEGLPSANDWLGLGLFDMARPVEEGGLSLSVTEIADILRVLGAFDLRFAFDLAGHLACDIEWRWARAVAPYARGLACSRSGRRRATAWPLGKRGRSERFWILSLDDCDEVILRGRELDGRVWSSSIDAAHARELAGHDATSSCELELASPLELGSRHWHGELTQPVYPGAWLTVAAACVGALQSSVDAAVAHACARRQFGVQILRHGAVQEHVGDAVLETVAAQAVLRTLTPLCDDRGGPASFIVPALSFFVASEALWRVADRALQVAGGIGYFDEHCVPLPQGRRLFPALTVRHAALLRAGAYGAVEVVNGIGQRAAAESGAELGELLKALTAGTSDSRVSAMAADWYDAALDAPSARPPLLVERFCVVLRAACVARALAERDGGAEWLVLALDRETSSWQESFASTGRRDETKRRRCLACSVRACAARHVDLAVWLPGGLSAYTAWQSPVTARRRPYGSGAWLISVAFQAACSCSLAATSPR